jgi:hypothetical protein
LDVITGGNVNIGVSFISGNGGTKITNEIVGMQGDFPIAWSNLGLILSAGADKMREMEAKAQPITRSVAKAPQPISSQSSAGSGSVYVYRFDGGGTGNHRGSLHARSRELKRPGSGRTVIHH